MPPTLKVPNEISTLVAEAATMDGVARSNDQMSVNEPAATVLEKAAVGDKLPRSAAWPLMESAANEATATNLKVMTNPPSANRDSHRLGPALAQKCKHQPKKARKFTFLRVLAPFYTGHPP